MLNIFKYFNNKNNFILEKTKIILDLFNYNSLEILNEKNFLKKIFFKILFKKKIKFKFGIDPNIKSIHLGHLFLFYKIKQIIKMKFDIIIIIGNTTSIIGDPTGKLIYKKILINNILFENCLFYVFQIKIIIKLKKINIYYNSEWLTFLEFNDLIYLFSIFEIKKLINRDDILKRYKKNNSIFLLEIIYSVFQSYDTVFIKNDIEIGGIDQKINFFITKYFQKKINSKITIFFLYPLLIGLDGNFKMSKSKNNFISIHDKLNNILLKILNIKDSLINDYFIYLSFKKKIFLKNFNFIKKLNFYYKKILALEIIKIIFNKNIALYTLSNYKYKNIRNYFNKIYKIKCRFLLIKNLIKFINITNSNNKSIFLIKQKMIKLNNVLILNFNLILFKGIYSLSFKNYLYYIFIF